MLGIFSFVLHVTLIYSFVEIKKLIKNELNTFSYLHYFKKPQNLKNYWFKFPKKLSKEIYLIRASCVQRFEVYSKGKVCLRTVLEPKPVRTNSGRTSSEHS